MKQRNYSSTGQRTLKIDHVYVMHMYDYELHTVCGGMAKRAGAMDVVDGDFVIQHTIYRLSAHGADPKQNLETANELA